MNIRIILFVIALLVAAAQIYVPVSMASQYEDILATGESYRFVVEPVDPADPFKGRYVRLTFPIREGYISDLESSISKGEFDYKQEVYASLAKKEDGLAYIRDLSSAEPKQGDYIKVKYGYAYEGKYRITLPFNRYYAEESKAPKIEAIVWDRQGIMDGKALEVIADVKIKQGLGVIEELYIQGTPILEFLQNADKK